MKNTFKYVFISFIVFLLFSTYPLTSYAVNIRKPVWAGKFYPGSKTDLIEMIDELTNEAKKTKFNAPVGKTLKAIIMPHAGYIYSGYTAAHASLVLEQKQFAKVVLLGPDHRVGFKNCAISDADKYETPLGLIKLHKDAKKLRKKSSLFVSVPESDNAEHSLEVILPYLQRYLSSFELVPIVMGYPENLNLITSAIDQIIDDKTLIVVSSDLSHFLPYDEAVSKDKETINMILNMKPAELIKSRNRACGIVPILVLMKLAYNHHWQPILIHYSNSGDTAGDKSKVVGYSAIAFFEDTQSLNTKNLSFTIDSKHGSTLLTLARHTIMKELGIKVKKSESAALASTLKNDIFQLEQGTFVTLKINGNLRGCIGNIAPYGSILESVRRNAINAAFHDPRFPPLTEKEFKKIHIEVSILTDPKPLKYKNSADLIAKLRPNIDGVIIQKDSANATFLPQVWQQLPNADLFLSHLCRKAGLQTNAWKSGKLDVFTYQVQYFEE